MTTPPNCPSTHQCGSDEDVLMRLAKYTATELYRIRLGSSPAAFVASQHADLQAGLPLIFGFELYVAPSIETLDG